MASAAMTETYYEVEKMLFAISNRFAAKTAEPVEELMSIANEAFCDAYLRFDPDKGRKFSTYLWHYVEGYIRRAIYKRDRFPKTQPGQDIPVNTKSAFSDLSDDAEIVARFVFDAPSDMFALIRNRAGWKRFIRIYLDELGWSKYRQDQALQELKGKK